MLAHDVNRAGCAPSAIPAAANNNRRPLRSESVLPENAVAHILRPARSAMTSGRAGTKHWRLVFERRRPLFIEPLMEWTGDDDPLAQVALSFPTAEEAIACALREGISWIVHPDHSSARGVARRRLADHPDALEESPPRPRSGAELVIDAPAQFGATLAPAA